VLLIKLYDLFNDTIGSSFYIASIRMTKFQINSVGSLAFG
jgi:hypothetical protein